MAEASADRRVTVLDLNIGEHDPHARSLILLELEDTQRTEFRGKTTRKVSIDRIFGKIRSSAVSQVDKRKLKGLPRRSLMSDIGFSFVREQSESDDDETQDSTHDDLDPNLLKAPLRHSLACGVDRTILPKRNESDDDFILPFLNEDDNRAKLLDLKIGETEPAVKSLVVLEMQDTQKTGFRRTARRKESVDRIFAKVNSYNVESGVDQKRLSLCPRRSLARDFEFDEIHEPSESDDESEG
jgi:hypothetical protein